MLNNKKKNIFDIIIYFFLNKFWLIWSCILNVMNFLIFRDFFEFFEFFEFNSIYFEWK